MSIASKITIEQFRSMIDRGDFEPIEGHHVELLRGEIVPRFGDDPRTPMNPPHASAVDELNEWSFEVAFRDAVRIRVEGSFEIPALDSVPLPDVAWLVRKDYSKAHPTPDDVLLLIEVSDSSLAKDLGPKLELYAEAGIRDYWVVDVQNRALLVHRDPQGITYRDVTRYDIGQEVHPLAAPEAVLPVSRVFPD